ncbi:MAG: periplasmic heavy metal sensor [Rhodocyclales bacterium]|nr:periplasmic heavy metal sensor [Rhodocyclales bacterium]
MNIARLRVLLAFSLLVNVGVLGAAAYRALATNDFPGLPRYLQLDGEQTKRWHEVEKNFLAQLGTNADSIRVHRDRMILAVFADTPDIAQIDAERAAIARLQDEQQKNVLQQLLAEREMLTADQRTRLARLLLDQPAGPSPIERLHRD